MLQGGPRNGDRVKYGQPLPKNLVVYSKGAGWQDYYRKPNTSTYIHVAETRKP